ncbi:hypothetical protein UPYG_G00099710 [Umbra pygmaea]|uniref:Uncharacterized protein n=1 Tax=Umbra pygmaea TaxID=75934 RepID=A0ABD0XKX5_UMBPY
MKPVLTFCAIWNIIQLSWCNSAKDPFTCVTDYWKNISCIMNITDKSAGVDNIHYWLEFIEETDETIKYKCQLVEMGNSYGCTFLANVMEGIISFMDMDCFEVHLCYDNNSKTNYGKFIPVENIQLTAPSHLTVQWTPEGYHFTWKSGYEHHPYYTALKIGYQLCFYNEKCIETQSIFITRSDLEPDTEHALKIRSQVKRPLEFNKRHWSPWSALVQFKTDAREGKKELF